jgi:hypothetical protein
LIDQRHKVGNMMGEREGRIDTRMILSSRSQSSQERLPDSQRRPMVRRSHGKGSPRSDSHVRAAPAERPHPPRQHTPSSGR